MAVLALIVAIQALKLIRVRMRFHMRVQHRLVHASVCAFRAFERLRTVVVSQMVLQMVFVLGDEIALLADELFFRRNMHTGVLPGLLFTHADVVALLAFIGFRFAGGRSAWPIAIGSGVSALKLKGVTSRTILEFLAYF